MKLATPISGVTNERVFFVFTSITSSNHIDDGSSQDLAMSLPEHSTCLQAEFSCGKQDQSLSLGQCTQ
jgi:hypothetical protein